MNEQQQALFRKVQWIVYPLGILITLDFGLHVLRGFTGQRDADPFPFLVWVDRATWMLVILLVGFVVAALIQQYYVKGPAREDNTHPASLAPILIRVTPPRQTIAHILTVVVVIGFSGLMNIILFKPESIFEPEQIADFGIVETLFFGLFYVITHFLLVVFAYSLIKGVPPVFIATEAGFCYQPAGISTGWILWREVADVKETTVLAGAPSGRSPTLKPVLGIRFHYPDIMNRDMYAPLLQRVVQSAQELYGAQTDGAGDLLLLPSDFGDAYEDVKSLFRTYAKADVG